MKILLTVLLLTSEILYAQIGQSLSRLAAGEPVRILIYGQSISKQNWWRTVAADLRNRYPNANLQIENKAIGGYSTQYLIRTMEADILPFHPDLIMFHDYGPEDLYEQIIRWIRSHTTAEILLQSDHVVWLPGEADPEGSRRKSYDFQERHSFEWLPALAQKYGLGLVNIRQAWHDYLKANQLEPKALLRDSVHLNQKGEDLYAQTTILYLKQAAGNPPYKEIEPRWKGNQLNLTFEGTRVDLVGLDGATVSVEIDNKRPAELQSLYYHSRPTNTWDADWPMIMHIGSQAQLQIEEWIAKVTTRNDPGTEFDFELYGSVTGFDGKGSSTQRFVSNSGRVIMEPADYDVVRSYGLRKIPMPGSWQIRWSSLPRFIDPVRPSPGPQTILYGLENTKHHLTLSAPKGTTPRIQKIRIYQPTLKEN